MLTMAGEHLQALINTHKALDMCTFVLQECIDCLKYEPPHQAEGKLCEQARFGKLIFCLKLRQNLFLLQMLA